MCGGPSQAQYTAQEQAQSEATQLQNMFTQQFSEQQGLLNNFLIPQLQSMISNPTGFGPVAMADLTAQLVNTTGTQAASARQSAQNAFDTNNLRGLPSGVQQAVLSQINSAAGNNIATGQENLGIANAQLQNQQRQFGISGLASAEQALGAEPQSVNSALNANNSSASQAYQINQEGNMWTNILGGVINGVVGAGLGLATGGLSTAMGGFGGLFGGGMSNSGAAALDASAPNSPFVPLGGGGAGGSYGLSGVI